MGFHRLEKALISSLVSICWKKEKHSRVCVCDVVLVVRTAEDLTTSGILVLQASTLVLKASTLVLQASTLVPKASTLVLQAPYLVLQGSTTSTCLRLHPR